jgi:hypothetical protein
MYQADGISGYVIHPFAFVQRCYDEKFRISLVFHVESAVSTNGWVGRYTYHLPNAIPVSDFANPTDEQLKAFQDEMLKGAKVLTDLLQRDISGTLPSLGRVVSFGSLYIIGNKLGGMGIYTMPEEIYFKDVELIEETDTYVTVRIKKGNMHATGVFGGMAFGIHRIDKNLVHTLKPA